MSLDCLSSSCVLCVQCCQCLWIVCLRSVSCVSNAADVSGLFVFVLCLNKQSRDICNIGHTRHRTKTNIPETTAALDTQDTERRQTIQKHLQHWTLKTQDEDKQSRDIGSIGHRRHRMKTNNPETSAAFDCC
jgi:hypothetical protein